MERYGSKREKKYLGNIGDLGVAPLCACIYIPITIYVYKRMGDMRTDMHTHVAKRVLGVSNGDVLRTIT